MEDDFESESFQRDERNRRFKNDNPKNRQNVMEVAKREEQKAKRLAQSQTSQYDSQIKENEEEEDSKKKSKKLPSQGISKEEKQQLYQKDMEDCAKAAKGKHKVKI